MAERETTKATGPVRWVATVRIVLALAALTPAVGSVAEHAPAQLSSSPAAHVETAADGEPPREAAEWEHHRRRHQTL